MPQRNHMAKEHSYARQSCTSHQNNDRGSIRKLTKSPTAKRPNPFDFNLDESTNESDNNCDHSNKEVTAPRSTLQFDLDDIRELLMQKVNGGDKFEQRSKSSHHCTSKETKANKRSRNRSKARRHSTTTSSSDEGEQETDGQPSKTSTGCDKSEQRSKPSHYCTSEETKATKRSLSQSKVCRHSTTTSSSDEDERETNVQPSKTFTGCDKSEQRSKPSHYYTSEETKATKRSLSQSKARRHSTTTSSSDEHEQETNVQPSKTFTGCDKFEQRLKPSHHYISEETKLTKRSRSQSKARRHSGNSDESEQETNMQPSNTSTGCKQTNSNSNDTSQVVDTDVKMALVDSTCEATVNKEAASSSQNVADDVKAGINGLIKIEAKAEASNDVRTPDANNNQNMPDNVKAGGDMNLEIIKIEDDDFDDAAPNIIYIRMENFVANVTSYYITLHAHLMINRDIRQRVDLLRRNCKQPTRLDDLAHSYDHLLVEIIDTFLDEVEKVDVFDFCAKTLFQAFTNVITARQKVHLCAVIMLVTSGRILLGKFGRLFYKEMLTYCLEHCTNGFDAAIGALIKERLGEVNTESVGYESKFARVIEMVIKEINSDVSSNNASEMQNKVKHMMWLEQQQQMQNYNAWQHRQNMHLLPPSSLARPPLQSAPLTTMRSACWDWQMEQQHSHLRTPSLHYWQSHPISNDQVTSSTMASWSPVLGQPPHAMVSSTKKVGIAGPQQQCAPGKTRGRKSKTAMMGARLPPPSAPMYLPTTVEEMRQQQLQIQQREQQMLPRPSSVYPPTQIKRQLLSNTGNSSNEVSPSPLFDDKQQAQHKQPVLVIDEVIVNQEDEICQVNASVTVNNNLQPKNEMKDAAFYMCQCGVKSTLICECNGITYCSATCQAQYWTYHEPLCHVALAKQKNSS